MLLVLSSSSSSSFVKQQSHCGDETLATTTKSNAATTNTTSSNNNSNNPTTTEEQKKNLLDELDDFNHPRQRRELILQALYDASSTSTVSAATAATSSVGDANNVRKTTTTTTTTTTSWNMVVQYPAAAAAETMNSTTGTATGSTTTTQAVRDDDGIATTSSITNSSSSSSVVLDRVYGYVHTQPLLQFLQTAWNQWVALEDSGRDPIASMTMTGGTTSSSTTTSTPNNNSIPALIPACTPLLREKASSTLQQCPSQHVIGQVSYYCTDTCTPIFAQLLQELTADAIMVEHAIEMVVQQQKKNQSNRQEGDDDYDDNINTSYYNTIYLLPYHPGHHASTDCFGGYCYVNHVAALASHLSRPTEHTDDHHHNRRVVILDIDYHCGNGTAAIFHDDPYVKVISIHCHPDYDYPFHMGYATTTGSGTNDDIPDPAATVHIPLLPGTGWNTGYKDALLDACTALQQFDPNFVLISLGLDTYDQDPCAIRRAGFTLSGTDYIELGTLLAQSIVQLSLSSRTRKKNNNNNDDNIRNFIPTVFVQEGGYRMDVIGTAAANVVTTFSQYCYDNHDYHPRQQRHS